MSPLEHPAAKYVPSLRNSKHSIDPSSILRIYSPKRLGTVTMDSLTDLKVVTALLGNYTGGSAYSYPSLSIYSGLSASIN